jgi:non-canonical (house-cleaning) NTP pyrophosphatase
MKLILGSESPLKRKAIGNVLSEFKSKKTFEKEMEIVSKKVNHDLPITPVDDDTFLSAKKRVELLINENVNEYDFFVGIESGLIKRYEIWFEECWCIVANKKNRFYYGYSSGLSLPDSIVDRMKKGEKHSEIVEEISKKNILKETWSVYTKGTILRVKSIEESFRNAFYYALTS